IGSRVDPRFALQRISAGSAIKNIVPVAAIENVIAGSAKESIGTRLSVKRVVEKRAGILFVGCSAFERNGGLARIEDLRANVVIRGTRGTAVSPGDDKAAIVEHLDRRPKLRTCDCGIDDELSAGLGPVGVEYLGLNVRARRASGAVVDPYDHEL